MAKWGAFQWVIFGAGLSLFKLQLQNGSVLLHRDQSGPWPILKLSANIIQVANHLYLVAMHHFGMNHISS